VLYHVGHETRLPNGYTLLYLELVPDPNESDSQQISLSFIGSIHSGPPGPSRWSCKRTVGGRQRANHLSPLDRKLQVDKTLLLSIDVRFEVVQSERKGALNGLGTTRGYPMCYCTLNRVVKVQGSESHGYYPAGSRDNKRIRYTPPQTGEMSLGTAATVMFPGNRISTEKICTKPRHI
jgi:hypothetical protein